MPKKKNIFVSNDVLTLEQAREIAKGVNLETGEGARTVFSSLEDLKRYNAALNLVEEANGV